MKTIAQELKENSNSADVLEAASNISIDEDQDYNHQETTFTFKDGSRLCVSYDNVEVLSN